MIFSNFNAQGEDTLLRETEWLNKQLLWHCYIHERIQFPRKSQTEKGCRATIYYYYYQSLYIYVSGELSAWQQVVSRSSDLLVGFGCGETLPR